MNTRSFVITRKIPGDVHVLVYVVAAYSLEALCFRDKYSYANLHPEHILVNSLGLLLVTLGVIVVYIVTNENYRRQPLPEEQPLFLSRDEKTSSADQ